MTSLLSSIEEEGAHLPLSACKHKGVSDPDCTAQELLYFGFEQDSGHELLE